MSDNTVSGGRKRLDSWKEIAAFFGRNERTVNRWEKERALPVHRMPGGERGGVYAYVDELTAWLQSADLHDEHVAAIHDPEPAADEADANAAGKNAPAGTSPPSPASVSASPLPSSAQPWIRQHISKLAAGLAVASVVLLCVVAYLRVGHPSSARLGSVSAANAPSPARAEAEELYLQGRYHWNKRTGPDLTQALDDFTKSTHVDPTFAKGYAGAADTYNLLREYSDMPGSQAFPLAIASAKKAVALDDSLSEGHRALAFAYFYWNWDAPGAEREFQRAIELDPNDPVAHHWYATALSALGRHSEALAEIERARKLDPTSSSIAADRAQLLANAGQTALAIAILGELENADPAFLSPHIYLARIYFSQMQFEKWIDESEKAAALGHDQKSLNELALLRGRLQSAGTQPMLELLLENQQEDYREGRVGAFMIADTLAMLGRNKEALDYLDKAFQRHEYILMSVGTWPDFRSLHDDPRFHELLQRVQSQPRPAA
jgi:tetratricopeptide (TPR) repeat protein